MQPGAESCQGPALAGSDPGILLPHVDRRHAPNAGTKAPEGLLNKRASRAPTLLGGTRPTLTKARRTFRRGMEALDDRLAPTLAALSVSADFNTVSAAVLQKPTTVAATFATNSLNPPVGTVLVLRCRTSLPIPFVF
jgi:hypothetical protein